MTWILIDGFNLAFRAFYAMPGLTRSSDGFPVGALHGWVRMLWKLQDLEGRCNVAVFFDKDGSQRHLSLHPEYKANRTETPPALIQQLPEVKKVTALLGLRIFERSGVEADDLIASAAAALGNAGAHVLIASADKDFAQCVDARTHLLTPAPASQSKSGWQRLDREGVVAKFGVKPEQIVDYLSLIGDAVDNIPGLKGVGPKTAAAWLEKYHDIAGILAARTVIVPERFRPLLAESESLLQRNRQLIAFKTDFEEEWGKPCELDFCGARKFFAQMEMASTLKEFERRHGCQMELF